MIPAGENQSSDKGNHFHRYLHYADYVVSRYKGNEPFNLFLKKYFSANKKHGSRDRRLITALCYGYFRLGFGSLANTSNEDKFLLGAFLAGETSTPLLAALQPDRDKMVTSPLSEKLEFVKDIFSVESLFPFKEELSDTIDFEKYTASFLSQPRLFTRLRPGKHESVPSKLKAAQIPFEKIGTDCLAFVNTQKISDILKIDEEVVIQDYNSQRAGELISKYIAPIPTRVAMWDCCAASGGKSILAWDLLKEPDLTVSDSRKAILENLKARFSKAGIRNYQPFVEDLSANSSEALLGKKMDFILADVPCTGSGTWGRTPEQMHFSSQKSIEKYASLQRYIVANTLPNLKDNGYLLYLTCSVFKKENEENIAFFQDKLNLEMLESQYYKGYEMGADTLYAVMLRKR